MKRPFFLVVALSFLSVLIHLLLLSFWNRGGKDLFSIHYFGDGMYKYLQAEDLISTRRTSFSCQYLGKSMDPDFSFLISTKVVTIKNHSCYFLYPGFFAYLISFPVQVFGKAGIFLYQHLVQFGFLLLTMLLAKREGLSKSNQSILLLLTFFGTGIFFSVFDLEEHLTVGFLFLLAYFLFGFASIWFSLLAVIAISASILFRTEMLIYAFLFPLYLIFKERKFLETRTHSTKYSSFIMLGAVGLCLWINNYFFFHPLGIKVFDPIHSGSVSERALSGLGNLFFSWPMVFNGFFFQFPLFIGLSIYLFNSKRRDLAVLFSGVLVFAFLSPVQSTLYLGMRFALFVYPLGLIYYFKLKSEPGIPKLWERFFVGWTLFLSFLYFYLFITISDSYYQNYRFLKKQNPEILVALDSQVYQSSSDLSHKIPVLLAETQKDWLKILNSESGKRIVFAKTKVPGAELKSDFLPTGASFQEDSNDWLTSVTVQPKVKKEGL